jgi:2-polyprenyl-3-methyl-5-hydroxy-6-metoxy-1,4-benzoquinol methylase
MKESTSIRTRAACPLCESDDLLIFVEREGVPVHQNVPCRDAETARSAPRGDLRLASCRSCGFVTNLAFREELLAYGEGYENDQTRSPTFEAHTDGRIASLLESGARGQFVVDVGCGQGQFLRRLCAAGPNRGVGYDPAYVGPAHVDEGRVSFVRAFYGGDPSGPTPDLVVCRHVIEHISSPIAFLSHLRAALMPDRLTRLAFETPTVDWILERTVIQDFFYEHCSYFTPESLAFAFERAGLGHFKAVRVFDGQYIWATAEYGRAFTPGASRAEAARITSAAGRYGDSARVRVERLVREVEVLRRAGPVAIWGAGAKGVTFLNLIDPQCRLIDCTVDLNSKKQHKFVAGTGHAIVPPAELLPRNVRTVVVMNPNYADEIRRSAAEMGCTAKILTEEEL